MVPKKQIEYLFREYEIISEQFLHWDTEQWNKSTWFLLAQSALLAGIIAKLFENTSQAQNCQAQNEWYFCIAIVITLLNFYLSYCWFRLIKRNREYLNDRITIGKNIESNIKKLSLNLVSPKIYSNFPPNNKKTQKSWNFELSIPFAFLISWNFVLFFLLNSIPSIHLNICYWIIGIIVIIFEVIIVVREFRLLITNKS